MQKTKGATIDAPRTPVSSLAGSLPQADDEFSALFDYLRRHTPTPDERERLRRTADVLEREALIDRLAAHSCRWLKHRLAELVRREVDRRLQQLENAGRWP